MKSISPSEFSAVVVKEMESNPQYKIKQELEQKAKEKDALDYARKTMRCKTCDKLESWGYCELMPRSDTTENTEYINFGCIFWEEYNE